MAPTPWYRSTLALLAATIVFPPAGLALVWTQRGKISTKVFTSLLVAAIGIGELFLVYGMRIELDGSGMFPIFTFDRREARYAELERRQSPATSLAPAASVPESAPAEVTHAEAAAPVAARPAPST